MKKHVDDIRKEYGGLAEQDPFDGDFLIARWPAEHKPGKEPTREQFFEALALALHSAADALVERLEGMDDEQLAKLWELAMRFDYDLPRRDVEVSIHAAHRLRPAHDTDEGIGWHIKRLSRGAE